jgi:O-antigen ligase
MINYLFFFIIGFLPLIEGEILALGDFLVFASCLPFSIYLAAEYKKIKFNKTHYFFIVFFLLATISTLFSPVGARSLSTLILYFVYFIYFLVAQILAEEKKSEFKEFIEVFLFFSSFILTLLSLYLYFTGTEPPFSTMNLIYANFGHNHLIDFLIFSLPISLVRFFSEKDKLKKLFFFILVTVFTLGFVLSFSVGGLLMALMILFLIVLAKRKQKYKELGLVSFALGGVLIGALLLSLKDLGFDTTAVLSNRLEYWEQAVLSFKERILLGWGLDNFRYLSKRFQSSPGSWSWFAHNHFLQLFVEVGVLGGLYFTALIISVLKKINKTSKENRDLVGFKVGLLASVVHSLFDYDWQFKSVFLIFWVIAGFLIQQSPASKKKIDWVQLGNKWQEKILKLVTILLGLMLFIVGSLKLTARINLVIAGKNETAGELQKAEKYYKQSINLWPYELDNWQPVISFYQQNKKEDYEQLLNRAINYESLSAGKYKKLGEYYLNQDKNRLAEKSYQQVIRLSPVEHESVILFLIEQQLNSDQLNWDRFYFLLDSLSANKGEACVLKCIGFKKEQRIEEALLSFVFTEEFQKFTAEEQAEVYYWLAVLSTYKEEWHKNIQYMEKAVRMDPQKKYQLFLNDLYLANEIEKDFEENNYKQVKKKVEELKENNKKISFYERFYLGKASYLLGKAYWEEGEYQRAHQEWQVALKKNPYTQRIYLSLAEFYNHTNQTDKEKKVLKDCINIDQEHKKCQQLLKNLSFIE